MCKHRKVGLALKPFVKRGFEQRRKLLTREGVIIVPVSNHIKEVLLSFGYPPERMQVVHSGIDTDTFASTDHVKERRKIMFVGRPAESKGIKDFLNIAKLYHNIHGNDLQFVLAGTNLSAPGVISLGWVERSEIARHLRECLAFLQLQYVSPGIGMSALEAMSCGVPVIAYSVPGIEEYVKDGEDAILVRPGDMTKIVELLSTLKEDSQLATKIGTAARLKILRFFSKQTMIQKYEYLYKKHLEDSL